MSEFFDYLIAILIVIPFVSVVANVVLWGLYREDESRSPTLRTWAISATVINIISFAIGFLAVRRLLGAPPFEWGAQFTVAAIIALECLPIYWVAHILWRRRNA